MSATHLLDTSTIIDILRGREEVVALVEELASFGVRFGITCVNVAEIFAGMKKPEEETTRTYIDSFSYIDIDRETAELAGTLFRNYRTKGKTLSVTDTLIAACCLKNNLTLITANVKHFPMPELRIIDSSV